jgi:hypothetical protein
VDLTATVDGATATAFVPRVPLGTVVQTILIAFPDYMTPDDCPWTCE